MENSMKPDQLASEEASCSDYTVSKKGYTPVQQG